MSEPRPPARWGDQADGLRRLLGSRPQTLAVAARETDVIEAYARIKRIAQEQGCHHFRIRITDARSSGEARSVFDNLQRVAREYLAVRLEFIEAAGERPAAARAASVRRSGTAPTDSVL
ncbi:MAG: hypothetical protein KGZ43_02500 [Sulfuritalea sp.]|nr:hypothetical protein [Sulfuritalea sp.]